MTDTQEITDPNATVDATGIDETITATEQASTIEQAHDAPALDLQPQIDAALAKQQADLAAQFLQETGHTDLKALLEFHQQEQSKSQELATAYKSKFEQAQIHYAILAESSEAVSPAFIKEFLTPKAVCDDEGNVTVDGKPVAQAVKSLFEANPFLAKAQGGTGSGAPTSTGQAMPKRLSRAEYERLPPNQRSSFVNGGGIID
jgi:hypothetical protein